MISNIIYTNGLRFHENEVVNMGDILICHPQGYPDTYDEKVGIPLRACNGYQVVYDRAEMMCKGVTFYAPPESQNTGEPHRHLRYVLACADGELRMVNGEAVLIEGDTNYVYSEYTPIKTNGTVKKGEVIGYVGKIKHGFGYGVTVCAYKGGDPIKLYEQIINIPSL